MVKLQKKVPITAKNLFMHTHRYILRYSILSYRQWLCIMVTLFFFISCKKNEKKIPPPDVSSIQADVALHRFDQAIFQLDTTQLLPSTQKLAAQYPDFFPFYVQELMQLGLWNTADSSQNLPNTAKELSAFINNSDMRGVYDSVQTHFKEADFLKKDFEQAFRYYKYYFPNRRIPDIYTCISAFKVAAFTYDTTALGISLDMYLGKNYPVYSLVGIPKYLSDFYEPSYLVSNSIKAWAMNMMSDEGRQLRLIDKMVRNGKMLYIADKLLPATPDSIKMAYTAEQMQWCEREEFNIWTFFLENNLLYETESRKVDKYVHEAPTSSGMPPESPGNIGSWIGWRIVDSYMKKNPNLSLEALIQMKDGQQILQASGYKPLRP